ncbi:MAG: hypothetical protein AB7G76_12875 [Steroidobacteraceae bacterium]
MVAGKGQLVSARHCSAGGCGLDAGAAVDGEGRALARQEAAGEVAGDHEQGDRRDLERLGRGLDVHGVEPASREHQQARGERRGGDGDERECEVARESCAGLGETGQQRDRAQQVGGEQRITVGEQVGECHARMGREALAGGKPRKRWKLRESHSAGGQFWRSVVGSDFDISDSGIALQKLEPQNCEVRCCPCSGNTKCSLEFADQGSFCMKSLFLCMFLPLAFWSFSATAMAETALQAAYLAQSAASGASISCMLERVRPAGCLTAKALKESADEHYRAMMPADMDGALYKWEQASLRCETRCDEAGRKLIDEAKEQYERLELKYLSEGLRCDSKMDSALCFRVLELIAQYPAQLAP